MVKKTWQKALTETVQDSAVLAKALKLNPSDIAPQNFPLKVPKAWLSKIEKGNPKDPILLQVLPTAQEAIEATGFSEDPLQERSASPIPGVLHKYHSRVLLIVTGACGVNCRYCFRRNFPYEKHQQGQRQWRQAVEYIARHPEINEVVLSGGDPLMASDAVLAKLAHQLEKIPHLKTLRIHTRLPVFIPERCDAGFVRWFTKCRLKAVLVTHVNHPNEIDEKFAKKMRALKKLGVTLLNQSVLLKGINDEASILKTLSEKLFLECDIQPYYLHLLDPVKGAAHFEVSRSAVRHIFQELLKVLPGYLVPRLVTEIPGYGSKVFLPL